MKSKPRPTIETSARRCVQAVILELRRFNLYDPCLPVQLNKMEDACLRACETAVESILNTLFGMGKSDES